MDGPTRSSSRRVSLRRMVVSAAARERLARLATADGQAEPVLRQFSSSI